MKEPVDHILRPQLPWRNDGGVTECGYDAAKVKTLTREEYFARLKEMGQQRTSLFTCMTCAQTAARWGTWDEDPRRSLDREIQWETAWRSEDRGVRLRDELIAIAELIANHRDEFDAAISISEQRRAWNQQKKTAAEKPKPKMTWHPL